MNTLSIVEPPTFESMMVFKEKFDGTHSQASKAMFKDSIITAIAKAETIDDLKDIMFFMVINKDAY